MPYHISVIVCTYNPTTTIFTNCINSIKKAAAIHNPFEIIIIDNNSTPSIATQFGELLNFKNCIIVNETVQGLTPARLRGIKEAKGDILVFIDDDNFIEENFFAEVVSVAQKHPNIGAYSGQVFLQYEVEPEEWVHRYSGLLVKRELNTDYWSNVYHCHETVPCGAGLVVLKKVADYYWQLNEQGKRPIMLDRSKNSLLSGGDNDLAYCAIDIGMGMGLFERLKLQHYIPQSRTTLQYLTELTKWIAASSVVLDWYRGYVKQIKTVSIRLKNIYYALKKDKIDLAFHKATQQGIRIGQKIVKDYENSAHS